RESYQNRILSMDSQMKALGDMFRCSIKTDSELVSVQDELQHITNYMAIQRIRYEDKINYEIDIEEALQHNGILKLILQPLVENAIYHGLENKSGKGNITIKGYVEKDNA